MKHFARITQSYASKNKAHEAIWKFIKDMDHVLLNSTKDRDDFICEIKRNVDKINRDFRRCADLNVTTYSNNREKYLRIDVAGVVIIDIHKVLTEWNTIFTTKN